VQVVAAAAVIWKVRRTLAEGGELGAVGVPGQGRDLVPVIGQHHALARRLDVPALPPAPAQWW
jgi:hypothetical protein